MKKDKYDAIIIGAGVGGLVCGCYLAKAGMKVLIVEQHYKVGGYCTSFKRKGFVFDAGIRGFVGCGAGGILGKIIKELSLGKRIEFIRPPVFDLLKFQDFEIALKNDSNETLANLQEIFPHESDNIFNFFNFLKENNTFKWLGELKNKSFAQLLDKYFKDCKLKSFWNTLRGDIGLPPSKSSALAGFMLCRGYILDGGYYPKGGMQFFSDSLAEKFKEMGGRIILHHKAEKIILSNNKAVGIVLKDKKYFYSNIVISNCDATQTFLSLIGSDKLPANFVKRLKRLTPSISVFAVFLGVKRSYKKEFKNCCALWYCSKYLEDLEYDFTKEFDDSASYVICSMPSLHDASLAPLNCESIFLYVGVPFKDLNFWEKIKNSFADKLIARAQHVIHNLKENVAVKSIATPYDFYRYTLNRDGASRGWISDLRQTTPSLLPEETIIENLFLCGHWTTSYIGNGGIALVANSGLKVAKLVKQKLGESR